jgi:hypothetical protein
MPLRVWAGEWAADLFSFKFGGVNHSPILLSTGGTKPLIWLSLPLFLPSPLLFLSFRFQTLVTHSDVACQIVNQCDEKPTALGAAFISQRSFQHDSSHPHPVRSNNDPPDWSCSRTSRTVRPFKLWGGPNSNR